jgi:uncharacterized protein YrrD
MDAKTLSGLAIVSIDDGEKVGTIDSLIFNMTDRRIAAFRITRGSLLSGKTDFIGFDDIHRLGPDALMITNQSVIEGDPGGKKYGSLPELSSFSGVRVVTESGAFVGEIVSVHIDERSGNVTEFEVSGGGLLATFRRNQHIPNSDVRSIGRDVAVVPDHYGETTVTGDDDTSPADPSGATPESDEGKREDPV